MENESVVGGGSFVVVLMEDVTRDSVRRLRDRVKAMERSFDVGSYKRWQVPEVKCSPARKRAYLIGTPPLLIVTLVEHIKDKTQIKIRRIWRDVQEDIAKNEASDWNRGRSSIDYGVFLGDTPVE